MAMLAGLRGRLRNMADIGRHRSVWPGHRRDAARPVVGAGEGHTGGMPPATWNDQSAVHSRSFGGSAIVH